MTAKQRSVSDQQLFELTVSIQPARTGWLQAVTQALDDEALSAQLGMIILLVWRLGPNVSQRVLAARTGVTPGTLVSTIDQGERLGLLTRKAVAGDRRLKEIELLPKGKRCALRIEDKLTALRRELLGDVSAEEISVATKVLKLLEERAQAIVRRGR